jgi:hypothetical protein
MKNKKLFTVLFVFGLLVLVAGLIVLSNQDNSLTVEKSGDVSDTNDTVEEINENEEESFFGSMQDLLTRGKSLKCTYNVADEDGEATGVIYVSGNKIRSEVEITGETGEKMEVDSIITEDWMYTWNSFMPGGTKMNIKEMQSETGEDYSQDEEDKMREELDYKCRSWIPDNSKFVVPTDIEFRDMTEMMQGFDMDEMEENVEEASAKLCEMCEMLTGEARDICRADAGCK